MHGDHSAPPGTGPDDLKMRFSSAPMGVRNALIEVNNWLCDIGIVESDRGSAEILLAEALNNISEHSYGENGIGEVELTVVHQVSELLMMLTDQGHAMPNGVFPTDQNPATCPDPTALAEGGFGWFLIQQLAHDMHYARDGATNRLQLTLSLTNTQEA